MPTTVTAIAAAPQDATVVRLQGVRVLTGSARRARTLVATRPGLPEENGLENPEDLEDPADLFLRARAPGERDAFGLSGGGMLWRPAPGGEQGAGPGRFERTDAGVFGSAEASPARAARGGGDEGEGVRKKTASALARAGISEDLPGGPGAAAPGALADKGPFTGEIDTGAQKGSEAYAQAGRAAAQRLRQSGRSELADRKPLEERKKRIERVTGGAAAGAARPAAPTAATIAARSEGEGADRGGDEGVDQGSDSGIDRTAASRSPSTLLPTATLRARSQGDAPPASPGGNAPRALPASRAARATIAATTTPLGSAASIPSPAALRAGARGAAIDLGAFAGPGDVVRVGGGGVRAVAPPEPQPEPAPGEADYAVSTFGGDAFEAGLAAASGMPRPKRGASPRDSAAAAAAAFAGAVKGAVNFFKRYGGGDWIDDLPLVGGAGSTADMFIQSDVVDGLIGKRSAAIGALRAWIDSQSPFQVVDARGNVVAQGARDPKEYARARKALITSMTTSIRQALIAAWKRNGKKGPKPTSDEARKIAEDLVNEAEAPPQESGAQSDPIEGEFGSGIDRCAQERRKCRERCGCDCICTSTGRGDDDPHPARDPSVRGLRLDTEPVTFAGPPGPFDAGWAMQVAEPDEPDDDPSTLGDGVYAQMPRIGRLTRRIAQLTQQREKTTSQRTQRRLDRKISKLEAWLEEALEEKKDEFIQALFDAWRARLAARGWSERETRRFLVRNQDRFATLFHLSLARQTLAAKLENAPEKYQRGLGIKLAEVDLSAALIGFELRSDAGLAQASDVVGLIRFASFLDDESVDFNGGDESLRQWVGVLARHPLVRERLDEIDPSATSAVAARRRDLDIWDFGIAGIYRSAVAATDYAGRWLNSEERLAAEGVEQADVDEVQALLRRADVARSIAAAENALVALYEWGEERSALEIGVYVGGAVALGVLTAGVGYGVAAAAGGGVIGAMTGAAAAGMVGGALESILTQSITEGGFDPSRLDWDLVSRDVAIGGVLGAVTGPFSASLRGATAAGFRDALSSRARGTVGTLRKARSAIGRVRRSAGLPEDLLESAAKHPTRLTKAGRLQELRPSLGGEGPRRWQNVKVEVPVQGGEALSGASRAARETVRPLARRVSELNLPYRVPKTLGTRLSRAIATRVRYAGVNESPILRQLRRVPGLRNISWEQHHVFLQQRWLKPGGPTAWYAEGTAEAIGLRELGNAGWNLMPVPRALNQALGRSPWGTFAFGTGVGVVGVGGSVHVGSEVGEWAAETAVDAWYPE